jgi:hypothetical protein
MEVHDGVVDEQSLIPPAAQATLKRTVAQACMRLTTRLILDDSKAVSLLVYYSTVPVRC